MKRLTRTLGALGVATGLGLGAAGLASAVTSPSPSSGSQSTPSKGSTSDQRDQKDVTVTGSIQLSEPKGGNEAGEDAALKAAAKITPDQAKQAALAAVPGTAGIVELSNDDGSVVYTVEITSNGTVTDVIIDAGNAKVLAQEPGEKDGSGDTGTEKPGTETHGTSGSDTPDTKTPSGQITG